MVGALVYGILFYALKRRRGAVNGAYWEVEMGNLPLWLAGGLGGLAGGLLVVFGDLALGQPPTWMVPVAGALGGGVAGYLVQRRQRTN